MRSALRAVYARRATLDPSRYTRLGRATARRRVARRERRCSPTASACSPPAPMLTTLGGRVLRARRGQGGRVRLHRASRGGLRRARIDVVGGDLADPGSCACSTRARGSRSWSRSFRRAGRDPLARADQPARDVERAPALERLVPRSAPARGAARRGEPRSRQAPQDERRRRRADTSARAPGRTRFAIGSGAARWARSTPPSTAESGEPAAVKLLHADMQEDALLDAALSAGRRGCLQAPRAERGPDLRGREARWTARPISRWSSCAGTTSPGICEGGGSSRSTKSCRSSIRSPPGSRPRASRGVVHRDLKPQNLFLAQQTNALPLWKILDFGVSRLTDSGGTLTQDVIVGTPGYMSPEQAGGGVDVAQERPLRLRVGRLPRAHGRATLHGGGHAADALPGRLPKPDSPERAHPRTCHRTSISCSRSRSRRTRPTASTRRSIRRRDAPRRARGARSAAETPRDDAAGRAPVGNGNARQRRRLQRGRRRGRALAQRRGTARRGVTLRGGRCPGSTCPGCTPERPAFRRSR